MGRKSRSPRASAGLGWRQLRRAALGGATTGALFALLVAHADSPSAASVMATTASRPAAPAAPVASQPPAATPAPTAAPVPTGTPVATPVPTVAPTPQPAALNVVRSTPPPSTPRPAPPPKPAPAPPPPPPPPPPVGSGAALATLQLVNQDRAAAGLAPLRFDSSLSNAAAQHAAQNAAAGQMSHNGIYQDLGAAGVAWTTLGECLGWDSAAPDPAYVNSMWLQSSEHRSIIMGSFTKAGAGGARSASGASYVSLILTS